MISLLRFECDDYVIERTLVSPTEYKYEMFYTRSGPKRLLMSKDTQAEALDYARTYLRNKYPRHYNTKPWREVYSVDGLIVSVSFDPAYVFAFSLTHRNGMRTYRCVDEAYTALEKMDEAHIAPRSNYGEM